MQLLNDKWLKSMIDATGVNFQFLYGKDFKLIFDMLYNKIKHCEQQILQKRFEDLWKKTSAEWHKEYGFRGYPSLSQWLEILAEKPLTEIEIVKKKKEYEDNLRFKSSIVGVWCNDPNLSISFLYRYKNPLNKDIKSIINTYCNVKENLSDERIKKMAVYLKEEWTENKQEFYTKLKDISRKEYPLLLT